MTEKQRETLSRINRYAESVMADIDPQKVQVSAQLDKLRPILQELADEQQISLEDMFIQYMDLQSEAVCLSNEKLKADLEDVLSDGGNQTPFLFR